MHITEEFDLSFLCMFFQEQVMTNLTQRNPSAPKYLDSVIFKPIRLQTTCPLFKRENTFIMETVRRISNGAKFILLVD